MNDAVVLVTGGAGNLGRAVTRAFLEAGSRVSVPVYKSDSADPLESEIAEFGDRLHTIALDLTTERGADVAVQDAIEWGGALDGVVHLVGGYAGGFAVAETPVETWDRMVDLNLKSAFLVVRSAVPALLRGGGGPLVFISSRAARSGRAGHGAYAIAKGGLITLVETLQEEYGAQGLRPNVVLLGTVDTEDNRRALPEADHESWTRPEEVAAVIRFLVSPSASAISGSAVPAYGRS
jgi:NAD(P)-dependent dehydrogenase (short-subunit alcohol dehydrogenase family)